jgi:phage FluMu protein Com
MTKGAVCGACGAPNAYGQIRCWNCGKPLVFPVAHRIAENRCPYCQTVLTAASSFIDTVAPSEGDITVCINCAEPLIFTADGGIRPPTEAELAEIATHEDYLRTQNAVRAAAYRDQRFSERACDHCGKPYRGPAVYCSFECAIADA